MIVGNKDDEMLVQCPECCHRFTITTSIDGEDYGKLEEDFSTALKMCCEWKELCEQWIEWVKNGTDQHGIQLRDPPPENP